MLIGKSDDKIMNLKCWILYFVLMVSCLSLQSQPNVQIQNFKEYFKQQLLYPDKIDYKDSYLLLPVILRHYGYDFAYSDTKLQSILGLHTKVFCIKDDCFSNFQPNPKYLNSLFKKWKSDTNHIDIKLRIASQYGKMKRKPSIDQLMSNRHENIYELTHAAVIWYLIKVQLGETEEIKLWRKILIEEVVDKINNRSWMFQKLYNHVNLDILLELFLALSLLDHLPSNLYEELLTYQLNDDAYSLNQQSCLGSTHATLIALWIFLNRNQ